MAPSRKTWISILIAAVIIVCVMALAMVAGTTYFIYRHVHTEMTSERTAEQEFAAARARFEGQQPLIELRTDNDPVIHRDLIPTTPASARKLETLRVLAYDDRAGKLVRVAIPFWLLHVLPSRDLSFLNDQGIDVDIDSDRVRLTIDDLERRGPGLVLAHKDPVGARVMVWTE
jgi:hypothetical protein